MEGIEKITAKILSDAQADIDQLNAQTQEKADAIARQAQAQADKETADILARGQKAADERLERLSSAAQMEKRKLALAAKQEVLGEAFDLALDKLCSLPEEDYIALLTRLAVEASETGKEQLIFSEADRARVGKQVVIAANECLVKGVAPSCPVRWPTQRWALCWARWSTPPPPWSPAPAFSPWLRRPERCGAALSCWTTT